MNLQWEGQPRSKSRNAPEWRRLIEDPDYKLPGEESRHDLVKRVSSFLDPIFLETTENILIVSHGGPLRAALSRYRGDSWGNLTQQGVIPHGLVATLDRDDALSVAVGGTNAQSATSDKAQCAIGLEPPF
jgi:broad specificity phosphatase PhoE